MENKIVCVCRDCGFNAPDHILMVGYVLEKTCEVCNTKKDSCGMISIEMPTKGGTNGL